MRRRLLNLMFFVLVFLLLFALNKRTEFTSDDYMYHYVYTEKLPTVQTRPLESPADIVESMQNHRVHQNGRVVPHAILQLVLLFEKRIFNLLNAGVFVLLGVLLLRHIAPKKSLSPPALLLTYLFLWFMIPQFGVSVLWVSGAVNYLWMACATLLFLLPYRNRDVHEQPKRAGVFSLGMLILGFLAGSANENSGGAVLLMVLLFLGKWHFEKRKLATWMFAGFIGAAAGLLLQLSAPINHARIAARPALLELLTERIPYFLQVTRETAGILLVLFVLLLLVECIRQKSIPITPLLYLVTGLAAGFVLIITPNMSARSWLWTVLFSYIATGILWEEADLLTRKSQRVAGWLLAAVLLFAAVPGYLVAYASNAQTQTEIAHTIQQIEDQKEQGIMDVTVTKFILPDNPYNPMQSTANLRDNPESFVNQWMALYYGVDTITIDNPQEMWR